MKKYREAWVGYNERADQLGLQQPKKRTRNKNRLVQTVSSNRLSELFW